MAGMPKNVTKIAGLMADEKSALKEVAEQFPFLSNEYYLSLIDWNEATDPIRRLVVPDVCELEKWGKLDPSNEKHYTVLAGLEHKYHSTAVFLISGSCGGLCRYCFRKRLFMQEQREIIENLSAAINYVREHKEITNVLLTGGDPLTLPTSQLEDVIGQLRGIAHVGIIRIGSKMPAYNPYRIISDAALLEMIKAYSSPEKRIYVITHFNHPREISEAAIKAVGLLREAGAITANQTPIIRGINDDALVLAELFRKLSFIGVPPYYVFQCRPTVGNKDYAVPVEEAYGIFEQAAKSMVSGLAKRARYVISHASGKIEVIAKTKNHVFFKYHRAYKDSDSGRFIIARSNPDAYWFDDYEQLMPDEAAELHHVAD